MSCYGRAWVGIGRCWWLWSRYGYKFEGKCWAPLNSSQEGQTLVYQTFLSCYLANQKILVCIWRISRVLLQHQTLIYYIDHLICHPKTIGHINHNLKPTCVKNVTWSEQSPTKKQIPCDDAAPYKSIGKLCVPIDEPQLVYIYICVCVTNKGHNTNYEFVDYPHRYVDKKICSHPMTHFIFIEWRWLWAMS